ncbi:uncharacterized protein EAF01_002022 [Botrytis porri]|uniref:Uncharacterized protein n=1 Tax=Botrytis porri TaxID=87229 RepID=A0A4Z1KDS3_9HELO|nr:uncharacterized protein EAF01_002022 [Botrytis porri]KAF7913001.1 hypothetical protein EAF01_002022 [Botrytis porri]TGO83546.1 hypothetical protein BPOR_0629g00040 [Botrytis porri]
MSGSGDSSPINHQGLPQGLGITSNQTSGRATPRDSLGGQNTVSRVNNPRVRAGPQMQQQDGVNNPSFGGGSAQMQQQMGINMLHQHRIEQQQAQNLQRQYHQEEQYRAQQHLQQQQFAAQQQMQRNQALQQRMQQQHVGQLQTLQPVHMLPDDIPSPSPTAMRLNGGQIEPAFQQLFGMPPTQFNMKNGRPNNFAPAAPNNTQPRVPVQQPEQQEAEEEENAYETNCLNLSISSPLTITGDNNIITFHPAPQVQKITDAILKSLHSASEGSRGIPMGDADGVPRAIKVEIDAAVTINGKHNILGEEAVKIWAQKVKGDALAAQTQAQRMLAQAHIKSQAAAQAQAQGQGQAPKNGTANMESTVQRNAQAVESIIRAREQALVTQRQIQNETAAQGQKFPNPQESFQMNGDANESVRGQVHPHWSMQAQASMQQQQQQQLQPKPQEGRTKPQMGVFPAGPSKDFGKRARESSVSQHDEEANKKTKMDM